jgi:hypothetical protein
MEKNNIMTSNQLIISPKTKVGEMLDTYPELEEVLMNLSPDFKKLKNPILRKTIGKIASLQQVASIGKIPVDVLVNTLRKEIGQNPTDMQHTEEQTTTQPSWFRRDKIIQSYDAREDINAGNHPMQFIFGEIGKTKQTEIFELITPFVPAPIIDKLGEKGYAAWTEMVDENTYKTYFSPV